MAGAPLGNQNGTKSKRLFAEAIHRAVIQEDGARLRIIAERLLTMAANGDMAAIREVADRLDGKAITEGKMDVAVKLAETLSEEHARLVAEGFLESLRSSQGDSAKEPDRLHNNIQT